ncbi:MAG TPA: ABC transporter permease, partial [Chitinophagaceae bacterium]|nr:ABC transporter permease [Chitinophagaceae bacterium]
MTVDSWKKVAELSVILHPSSVTCHLSSVTCHLSSVNCHLSSVICHLLIAMLKQYFKIAIRNLVKQKGLALINILGLSIGIACFSLFILYALNEFNFDRFHQKADNIFRVYRWTEAMGDEEAGGDVYMPMPLGPAMKKDLPDIVDYVRMREDWGKSFIKADGQITRLGITFADPNFFEMFNFTLLHGEPTSILKDPRSLVLTEQTAQQLFGRKDPMGKIVEIKLEDKFEPFTITGIVKNIPANSSIVFEAMGNFHFLSNTKQGQRSENNWFRSSYPTFVQLKEGSRLASDFTPITNFRKKYYPNEEAELKKA